MTQLQRAIYIAESAHRGQVDKTGASYIEHCRRVAGRVETRDEKIVAYLHDTLEKGHGWSPERLREAGFSKSIVAAVDALTKRPTETDHAFIRRAASNKLARAVKWADLQDNLAQVRETGASTQKYEDGLSLLRSEFSMA